MEPILYTQNIIIRIRIRSSLYSLIITFNPCNTSIVTVISRYIGNIISYTVFVVLIIMVMQTLCVVPY